MGVNAAVVFNFIFPAVKVIHVHKTFSGKNKMNIKADGKEGFAGVYKNLRK